MNLPDRINGPRINLRVAHNLAPQAFFDLVMASKKEIIAFLPWAEKYASVADAEASIARFKTLWDDGVAYTYALETHDGAFLGAIDWRPKKGHEGSIGYWLGTPYTGKGYMTTAVSLLLGEVFKQGVHRAIIQCHPDNKPSAEVAKRAGFTFEGRLRSEHLQPDGSFRDTLQFSRLATDPYPNGE